ncbi:hypothetical protein [Pseudomonas sp. 37 R 15]|nr:hypothetical protein [Pseudomonas sp. 37 R 15]
MQGVVWRGEFCQGLLGTVGWRSGVQQHHRGIEQQIDQRQLARGWGRALQTRQVLLQAADQHQQPTAQHGRAACQGQQQGVEQQPGAFHHNGPAAFAVGHRRAIRQVHQRPCGAAEQVVRQLAVDLRLQPLFGAFIDGQRRGQGLFRRGEFIPGQEANDVRLGEAAVVVDRPGPVAQPGQYTGLQLSGGGQRIEQGLACRVLIQGIGIQRSIQQVRASAYVAGFDDEEIVHSVRRGTGLAAQGQRAQHDLLIVNDSVCRVFAHQGFYIPIAGGGNAVLLPDRILQREHRQVDLEFRGKQVFSSARLYRVGQQQLLDLLWVAGANVDALDQAVAAQQVVFAQPGGKRRGAFGGQRQCAFGLAGEILQGQFRQ